MRMFCYTIIIMYDEDEFNDAGEIGLDTASVSYEKKGTDDRAFVDTQAKEYDEIKRKKRAELEHLKTKRLSAQSKLSAKEHELSALELLMRKDDYLDTKERVRDAREEVSNDSVHEREETATKEVAVIANLIEHDTHEAKHTELLKEKTLLKSNVDEVARQISLLEHEILRS